jgi:hypothetical protein
MIHVGYCLHVGKVWASGDRVGGVGTGTHIRRGQGLGDTDARKKLFRLNCRAPPKTSGQPLAASQCRGR